MELSLNEIAPPKSGEYITYTIKIRFRISVRSLCATYHKIKDLIII